MPARRDFLTQLGAAGMMAGTAVSRLERLLCRVGASDGRALPSAAQVAWQDLEVGMFVHFAPNTWQDREYDDRTTPLSAFTPDIDTDQWADVAVALGARYVVLVAKHVGGFCLWQTGTTEYSIGHTPWRGGRGARSPCDARRRRPFHLSFRWTSKGLLRPLGKSPKRNG